MAADQPAAPAGPTALEVLVLLLTTVSEVCELELRRQHAEMIADLKASGLPSQDPPPTPHPEVPRG